ncbi:MAG: hypothetical protein LBE75_07520 [Burkholderiales bacterium]|jgi:hypothetical protein|nr:hypothetical protein [Burkholderiales bacterium]
MRTLPPTVETLETAGRALFGESWQTDMARALDLSGSRRVRAWVAGERSIPPGMWSEIANLLRERGKAAVALANRMPKVDDGGKSEPV